MSTIMNRTAHQIRGEFIEFFKSKGHTFVPSAPVVPQDDPTLLFTNAGMNQFKSIFLGDNSRGLKRAANSQKCMRVSGKHNDLEEVGRDHYHHTFFEMLGNWSFGDYYKKEAIGWAWELLTRVWGLPKDRLYATVYKKDDDAESCWKRETDIDPSHISRHGEKDNFWEMGETGPCGPCTEIHIDCGEDACADPSSHQCGPNAPGCTRFMEIWNLVFIQYNREKDGSLHDLPSKHVDTGMGFERIVRLLQGKKSNYDIDVFTPIIAALSTMSGKRYSSDIAGTPFRVIADHIRSLTFSITDGAFPANEGRGYVVRRLLRRAVRFGRELGFCEPFLYRLVPTVIDVMGAAFPEIGQRRSYVEEVIRAEEERFGATLEQGIERFNAMVIQAGARKTLSGADVFQLYDTFGFPMDLTRLMASEKGIAVDEAEFDRLMEQQRTRARNAAARGDDAADSTGWVELLPVKSTSFTGYDRLADTVRIARYKPHGDGGYLLALDTTPFYAASGGQVGDIGELITESGRRVPVTDTVKLHDAIIHTVSVEGGLAKSDLAAPLRAQVNADKRAATRRNHSATHLLQAALRGVLGGHVQQSGSRVDPLALRFDFTHFKALSAAEIAAVERRVNEWIVACLPVTCVLKPIDEAKKEGAIALFGEKYGDVVRMVTMGSVSRELCGGTHVASTGEIGLFHITEETSIAAGVRRIAAVTGLNSLDRLLAHETTIGALVQILKVGEAALAERVGALLASQKKLESDAFAARKDGASRSVADLIAAADKNGKFPWIVRNLGTMDRPAFSTITDALSDTIKSSGPPDLAFVLGATDGSAVFLSAGAGKKAVDAHGLHSGNILKEIAAIAGGSGGGGPLRAQAGGKDPSRLNDALAKASELIKAKA
jgi:alanyl-tRNA synthetase